MIYFIHDFNHFIVMALLKILLFCAHLAAKYITFGYLATLESYLQVGLGESSFLVLEYSVD